MTEIDMSPENCLFCKIIKREIPADIVFEDDDVLCFKDINPQAPVHLLVIPKKHIPTMNDIAEVDFALMGRLTGALQKIARQEGFENKRRVKIVGCKMFGDKENGQGDRYQ